MVSRPLHRRSVSNTSSINERSKNITTEANEPGFARREEVGSLRRQRQAIRRRLEATNGNVGLTAREFGVSCKLVKRLLDFHGLPVNTSTGPRIYGARTEARQAVAECLARTGGNIKRTVRETGIPESTVRRWRDELEATS